MTTTTAAQDVQPGQTVRFKRRDHVARSPRITVEVTKVDTFHGTTVLHGRRVTRDTSAQGRANGWTTYHRVRCYSMGREHVVEVVAPS